MSVRKITAINAHKKCRPSTGMGSRLRTVICAEKRGFNLPRFLPSHETNRTKPSIRHRALAFWQTQSRRFHVVIYCATAHRSPGRTLLVNNRIGQAALAQRACFVVDSKEGDLSKHQASTCFDQVSLCDNIGVDRRSEKTGGLIDSGTVAVLI